MISRLAIVEDGVELGRDVSVAEYAIVRAGASLGDGVTRDVPGGCTVMGIPARRLDRNGGKRRKP